MISSLKLVNFRNFGEKKLDNFELKNFIVGENGIGKTNVLEALSILTGNSITGINIDDQVKKGEDYLYIEYISETQDKFSFSYDGEKKKKNYMLNGKNTSKKKFSEKAHKSVIFSPIIMNLMYLSPSLRRDFLDEILINSYPEYEILQRDYKKIIKSRNKTLKNISEQKSEKSEINFWNEKFIEKATAIYSYRNRIILFFQAHISKGLEYFNGKVEKIDFIYDSKIDFQNTETDLRNYITKNLERDIILAKTPIGPHVDDFNILLDGTSLIDFASRGETKSMIIWLKLLETVFIEKVTGKKPVLFIDDLLSELDSSHKNMLLEKIKYYQTFISSIERIDGGNIINI